MRPAAVGHGPAGATRAARAPRKHALDHQHQQPQQHERDGERPAASGVELELGEDLGRECLVAEDLERAVLGDHGQGRPAHIHRGRRADQRERHPPKKVATPSDAEAVGGLLHAGVGSAQRRGDREVDERIGPQRHHDAGAEQRAQPRCERMPGVADDEVGNRNRQHQQNRPHPPCPQCSALGQPRGAGADGRREQGDDQRRGRRCDGGAAPNGPETGRGGSLPSRRCAHRGRSARAAPAARAR